jgi:hypothetical protein
MWLLEGVLYWGISCSVIMNVLACRDGESWSGGKDWLDSDGFIYVAMALSSSPISFDIN